jgi:hydrogenase maturation protease
MTEFIANRKIVMGLGNILNHDEGMGVHALEALKTHIARNAVARQQENPGEIEFIDGGVLGLNLLPWVEEASHLLILDAVEAQKEPGTIIVLQRHEIHMSATLKLSDHQQSFQEVLGLAAIRNHLPEKLLLIGVQPLDLSTGVGLSPVVAQAIPRVVSQAETILREWELLPDYGRIE